MERRIIAYQMATGTTTPELIHEVNIQISRGWEPFGNMQLEVRDELTVYYQPIVRYKQDQDDES